MRRLASILLIGLFSFSLAGPMLLAQGSDARIPECCRREGKHRCSMGSQSGRSVVANCPMYGDARVAPANGQAVYLKPSRALFGTTPEQPAIAANRTASYDSLSLHSTQVRGPPEPLS